MSDVRIATCDVDVTDPVRYGTSMVVYEFVTGASPVSVYYADMVEQLAYQYDDVTFVRVNADRLKRFTEIFKARTFPTFVFWKTRIIGAYVVELEIGGTSEYELEHNYNKVFGSLVNLVTMYK